MYYFFIMKMRFLNGYAMLAAILFFLPVGVRAQQPGLVLPTGHTEYVRTARFSPNGKFVITGGEDKTVIVWETLSGKKIQSLGGNKGVITYTLFSSDNKYLAVGTDSIVVIWSVPDYAILGKFDLTRKMLFSPDNKRACLLGYNGEVKQLSLPSLSTEFVYQDTVLYEPDPNHRINRVAISPDSKLLATVSADSVITVRNMLKNKIVGKKKAPGDTRLCFFSNDNRYLRVVTDLGLRQYDLEKDLADSALFKKWVVAASLSNNGKYLLMSWDMPGATSGFWDMERSQMIFHTDSIYSVNDTLPLQNSDGETTGYRNGTAALGFPRYTGLISSIEVAGTGQYIRIHDILWNNNDNRRSYKLPGNDISRSDFSPDGKYLLVQQKTGSVGLWDVAAGKVVQTFDTKVNTVNSVALSPDGRSFSIAGIDNSIHVVDLQTGQYRLQLKGHSDRVGSIYYSSDSKMLLTNSFDSTARMWDAQTGALIKVFKGFHPELNPAWFDWRDSVVLREPKMNLVTHLDDQGKETEIQIAEILENPDNVTNRVSPAGNFAFFKIPDYESRLILTGHSNRLELPYVMDYRPVVNAFSRDEKWIAIADSRDEDSLWVGELETGKWIFRDKLGIGAGNNWTSRTTEQLLFSSDKKYLLVTGANAVIHVLSTTGFKPVAQLPGKRCYLSFGDKFLLVLNNGNCDIYDFGSLHLLYTYIAVDSTNYLVVDDKERFDGTGKSRKLLYYSCGNEIVDLDQAKDQLWVPNLVERIMKGETIHAKTLDELNICGLTPEVESRQEENSYSFQIIPRRGGLGETVLYVNGIEAGRYPPEKLAKKDGSYELRINKEELVRYFIPGRENEVTVKAFTAGNNVSSRGAVINSKETTQTAVPPNFYAVMIGISDYKGDELDLKYAAKDAADMANATGIAARKLLNTDGKEHVFVYNLNTSRERDQLPEKNAVKKLLEEIGRKATANDILMIFFAGHGVMSARTDREREGSDKQFYFLTADASTLSSGNAVSEVGISTAELTEWMKPQNIKAQKRILIFDACNSGQAIKDFVKMGAEEQQYLAARNDDKARQIKAIDKLNERSGLFILSASASDQSAYEMGRYAQGLLTYSLLKAIKQQTDILEDGKYLNVARWFDAAEKTVSELSRETGARQEPQIVSTTNFNIGIVDEEVMAKIVLPQEKPLFAASNFQNSDEAIADDDLELSKMVNLQLGEMATRGSDSKIVYVTATNSPDAWSLSGRYTVKGNSITATVNIKQGKAIKHRFEISGTTDKLKDLAIEIADKSTGMIK